MWPKTWMMLLLAELSKQASGVPIVSRDELMPMPIDTLREGLAIHKDDNNCCVSCGYSYCPSLDNCVRPWETYCQEFDFPYNVLYQGSGIILPPPEDKVKPEKEIRIISQKIKLINYTTGMNGMCYC